MNVLKKTDILGTLSIFSGLALLWATNYTNRSAITFFDHEVGTVCPFGVHGGRLAAFLAFVQGYIFFTEKNTRMLQEYIIVFTLAVFWFSFMNSYVQRRLYLFFFLQLLIVFYI